MKRTPIIVPGQVYLHTEANEYVVVTEARRGDITYKGDGVTGHNDHEIFLERFGPVAVEDLEPHEVAELIKALDHPETKLSTGWVEPVDELTEVE